MMLPFIILVFFAAATLGAILATAHFRGTEVSLKMVMAHGVTAVAGLVLLTYGAVMGTAGLYGRLGVILMVAAAAGGLVLLFRSMRGKRKMSSLVFAHGGVALIGLALLISTYFL